MVVTDGTATLIEQTTSPIDRLLAQHTTFPLQQTIQVDLSHSEMSTIYSNTETVESHYFYHQRLSYTPSEEGLYWLDVRSAYGDRLSSFWVYDGTWKWYESPVWETSNANKPFTVLNDFKADSTIPFLRWNDSLLLEHRSWKDNAIQSTSYRVYGNPTEEGTVPLQISRKTSSIIVQTHIP